MYDKEFYRAKFISMKPYIKLSKYCEECGIYKTTLSKFMKDSAYDDVISVNKLDNLYMHIVNNLSLF